MKKTLFALAIGAALLSNAAQAEQGDWVVRLRATHINPDESSRLGEKTASTYGTGIATALYGNRIGYFLLLHQKYRR
jgi:outer membrane protein